MKQSNFITKFAEAKDPLSIEEYKKLGGFKALEKAAGMSSEGIINEIKESGLKGRGGAGVSTGFKWSTLVEDEETYIVCNADEGEPGTFKDRYLMKNCPYLLIEGMAIAGITAKSKTGYIYIRGEYPIIAAQLEKAIKRAEDAGYLGNDILGTGKNFSLNIRKGGGSYVVGDETALLNSLMGNRGYPMFKPPYPTQSGLWEKPTIINNVETLSCIPLIIKEGAKWFAKIGSKDDPGPKLYCLSGHVKNPGVYEFPMGVKLSEIIDSAGGIEGNFKAVQIGGTAGPVYDKRAMEFNLDYSSMKKNGGALGSGAIVVMNTTVNMVHVLEVITRFFSEESCGQCFACRYGTRQLEFMAKRMASGEAKMEYLTYMDEILKTMDGSSFCPFGQSVKLPLSSLFKYFGDEIKSFLKQQRYMKEVV